MKIDFKENRPKIISGALTAVIMLIIVVICLAFGYDPPNPPIPEEGVEVNLGDSDFGLGECPRKHGGGGSQGVSEGSGNQGNPNGNPNSNSYVGNASSGNGSFSLAGRSAVSLPSPSYNSNKQGKIVVQIWVDQQGRVTRVEAPEKGSTITDGAMVEQAKKAARLARFNASTNAPEEQKGTITYIFKI